VTEQEFLSLKILIVDDDEFILHLSERILDKLGCKNVMSVTSGTLALDKVAVTKFDVLITDLNMPEMDGVELLRHVAGHHFAGGIILLSGEDERMLETAQELARYYQLNVLGSISKPLRPDLLKDLLRLYKPLQPARLSRPLDPVTADELRIGLTGEALQLFYQPKVSVIDGKINGVEALARWHHPDRGILGPAAFIPVAEELGLIDEMSKAIYQKAVRQAGIWLTDGLELFVSINFSVNSFLRREFSEHLIEVAHYEGVAPSMLILEVTESQVMADAKGCLEQMMHLRLKRFGLSIDDFGTGHSSLEQLKRIPFTELKVDRTFVYGANRNASARAILESSVALGKKLGMSIVAEGAETREDWDVVEQLGCDFVQGYYVARPMPVDELEPFVRNWTGLTQTV